MHTRPPSILILNRTFPPVAGATGRLAYELAKHLSQKGHPVTIITTASEVKTERLKNLTIIRVQGDINPKGAFDYYRILKRMEHAAKKVQRHNFVISMTDPPMLAAVGDKIAKRMQAKHIQWCMDVYPDLFPVLGQDMHSILYGYIKRKIYKAMRAADKIVPISACMAKHLTYNALPRSHMEVIENWPEEILYGDDAQEDKEDNKFRVLYAGNIGLGHHFETILKAAKHFLSSAPEIEFCFVGHGRGKANLEQAVKKQNLQNVKILPRQSRQKLKSMLESGDVHLVTMKADALGLLYPSKLYAAFAVARPVIFIGPEACDIANTLQSNNCGLSLRPQDTQSLINAITDYRHNADLWFAHSQNASKIVKTARQDRFTQWDKILSEL
jgi:glycosyltransferase involved in cell wall biosynthesis